MTTNITIPSNPVDQKKINDAVNEACDCLLRIDSERDQIKAIVDVLCENFKDIPRKIFNRMIAVKHKASFDKDVQESEDFATLYETVIK